MDTPLRINLLNILSIARNTVRLCSGVEYSNVHSASVYIHSATYTVHLCADGKLMGEIFREARTAHKELHYVSRN